MRIIARILLAIGIVVTCALALVSHPPAIIGVESDPTKHVMGLAALTLLSSASFPGTPLPAITAWLALASFLLEICQGLPPFARDPDVLDWLAGMIGVLMALPFAMVSRSLLSTSAQKTDA